MHLYYNNNPHIRDLKSPIENVLDLLMQVQRSGKGWTARCPAHEDLHPSLSLSEGDDGRVLLWCHAGCRIEEILDALGLDWSDLFPTTKGD